MTDLNHSTRDKALALGLPTGLESYQRQCLMLVDELHEAWSEIRRLKADARTLTAMNDVLESELKVMKASDNNSLNGE